MRKLIIAILLFVIFNLSAQMIIDHSAGYPVFIFPNYIELSGDGRVGQYVDIHLSSMKKGVGNPPIDGLIDGFPTLDFDKTTDEETFAWFNSPSDWDGTEGAIIVGAFCVDTAPVGAENVVWGIEFKSIAGDGNISFSSGTTTDIDSVAVTTGTPANDLKRHYFSGLEIGVGDLIQGGILMVRFYRDANHGSDTFDGDARLISLRIIYTADKIGNGL